MPLNLRTLTFLDLEATGTIPANDDILEVAIGLYDIKTDRMHTTYSSLVRFTGVLPLFHRDSFDAAELAEAPPLDIVLERIAPLLEGATIAGMRPTFDLELLYYAYQKTGVRPPVFDYHVFDLMSPALILFCNGEIEGTALKHTRRWAGIPGTQKHRALSDIQDAATVFRAMRLRMGMASTVEWQDRLAREIHNQPATVCSRCGTREPLENNRDGFCAECAAIPMGDHCCIGECCGPGSWCCQNAGPHSH